MTAEIVNPEQLKKNRRVLLGIVGIPVVIFALSTGLYFLVQSKVIELGTVNNGELILPPLRFTDMPLMTVDDERFDYSQPEAKWAFVVIGDSRCEGECERMLYIARQSIIALAKKMNRVRLVYLTRSGTVDDSLQQRIDREYHGIDVVTVKDEALTQLFEGTKQQPFQPRSFFVVDPNGWLMMSYQVENTQQETLNTLGKAIIRDMKRLIK